VVCSTVLCRPEYRTSGHPTSRHREKPRSRRITHQLADAQPLVEIQTPVSASHCWELVELLGWCHPAERFAWTFVQLGSDLNELAVGDRSEVAAAG
jgi:hypothetical protein